VRKPRSRFKASDLTPRNSSILLEVGRVRYGHDKF
jgi:hypothetical protein